MIRSIFVLGLAVATLGAVASSAYALPRGTPIYRACMQDVADDFLYGGNSLFGTTDIQSAISMAHAYCSRARVQ